MGRYRFPKSNSQKQLIGTLISMFNLNFYTFIYITIFPYYSIPVMSAWFYTRNILRHNLIYTMMFCVYDCLYVIYIFFISFR